MADLLSRPLFQMVEEEEKKKKKPKPSQPMTPRQILEEVKRRIMSSCHKFYMDSWFDLPDDAVWGNEFETLRSAVNKRGHFCGTSACIAGWACIVVPENHRRIGSKEDDVDEVAVRLLGVQLGQAWELFIHANWPADLRKAYENAPLESCEAARIACRAIDWWMDKHDIK